MPRISISMVNLRARGLLRCAVSSQWWRRVHLSKSVRFRRKSLCPTTTCAPRLFTRPRARRAERCGWPSEMGEGACAGSRACALSASPLPASYRGAAEQARRSFTGGEVVEVRAAAFVPVEVPGAQALAQQPAAEVDLQARLPNGVVVDLRGC